MLSKVVHIVERSELTIDELRVERNHRRDRELFIGQDDDRKTRFVVTELYLLLNYLKVLRSVLLYNAYTTNVFDVHDRATIKNWELRTIYLN